MKWCAFDLSGRTIRKTTMAQLEFPEYARIVSWRLTAAGGGLLCFAGLRLRSQQRFLVCNPMTKAWRELPDVRFDYSTHWVTVVEKKCRSSYKILFAGDGAVDVYDSAVSKWSAVEPLTPQMSFSEMTWGSGTYHNGEIYIVGKLVRNGPKVVMILDPATLRWREDTISMPATFMENPFIVGWSGEVYLVGGIFERPVESILLFRLDAGGKWTQVGGTPIVHL